MHQVTGEYHPPSSTLTLVLKIGPTIQPSMLKKQLLIFSLMIPLNFHFSEKIVGFRFFPTRTCVTINPVLFPVYCSRQRNEKETILIMHL